MNRFPGFYLDGVSAEQRPVSVEIGPDAVAIRDDRQRLVAEWRGTDIRLVEEVYRGQPVRLRATAAGDARLLVRDHAVLDALRRAAPHLGGDDMRRSRALPRALTWSGATVAVLAGIYFGLPLAAEPVASLMPLSWEEQLGQSVMRQVTLLFGKNGQLKECQAPAGRQALDRLVLRLSAQVQSRYTFRIQVVDSAIVNALAAPGGYIVVFRGLIDKAGSAEEVAGVIGHEMGHVIERHGTESLVRQQSLRLLLGAVVDSTAVDIGTTLAALKYGRDAEAEADRVGVAILNKADIRAAGMAAFFRRMAGKDEAADPGLSRYISTHPPSTERARDIEAGSSGKGDAMSAADWQALRAICAGPGK